MNTFAKAAVLALALGLLASWPLTNAQTGQAQVVRTGKQEVDELTRLLITPNMTIYLQNNPATLKGTPTGVVDLLGKRFLVLTKTTGGKTLVNTESIAAIQGD
jgi:hypothetical protein